MPWGDSAHGGASYRKAGEGERRLQGWVWDCQREWKPRNTAGEDAGGWNSRNPGGEARSVPGAVDGGTPPHAPCTKSGDSGRGESYDPGRREKSRDSGTRLFDPGHLLAACAVPRGKRR